MIDVWGRREMALDGGMSEYTVSATDLERRACLHRQFNKGDQQPIIFHTNNGNSKRADNLESRLEELDGLRTFASRDNRGTHLLELAVQNVKSARLPPPAFQQ